MWIIGKANDIERRYLENLGGKTVENVDPYDLEKVIGPINDNRKENEEFVVLYFDESMVEGVEGLKQLSEDKKTYKRRKDIHKERKELLEEIQGNIAYDLRKDGCDFEIDDWTCDGDKYELVFPFTTSEGDEDEAHITVIFKPDSTEFTYIDNGF